MAGGKRLRVLIADDEKPARAKVRRFLADDPDVGVIHEAWDGPTALTVIRESEPDLVFLDIAMPGMTGLQLLEQLPADAMPHVVFVTAYDRHAVRAFELAAVDYLLKPFDAERFARALGRAKAVARQAKQSEGAVRLAALVRELGASPAPRVDRVLVDAGDRRIMVALADVDRIEAERNYVLLHVGRAAHRLRATLSELEDRLDPAAFARVGRGTIVNLSRVAHLKPVGHGDYTMALRDGTSVRLSRRYVDRVANRLGL